MNEHVSAPLRVFLVDDCPDVRRSIEMLLRMWGHEVRTAGDGLACLSAAEDYLPHVVLLDVSLPGMDGYEVARRLHAQASGQSRPRMVTISGYGREEDFARSRTAGCDCHLVKPVDLRDLRRMLDRYAEEARMREQRAVIT